MFGGFGASGGFGGSSGFEAEAEAAAASGAEDLRALEGAAMEPIALSQAVSKRLTREKTL